MAKEKNDIGSSQQRNEARRDLKEVEKAEKEIKDKQNKEPKDIKDKPERNPAGNPFVAHIPAADEALAGDPTNVTPAPDTLMSPAVPDPKESPKLTPKETNSPSPSPSAAREKKERLGKNS